MRNQFSAGVAGVIFTIGILSVAFAQQGVPSSGASAKQVTVKVERISAGGKGKKSADVITLVADAGHTATSTEETKDERGVPAVQSCEVTAMPNADGTVSLRLRYEVHKGSPEITETCSTTITVKNGETRVIKAVSRKVEGDNRETLLFVTPSF
ncbi:MAG: hypothetical protein ACAH95_04125 [Fimbriimonas sp.]